MKTLDDLKKIKSKLLVVHYACTSVHISPVAVTAISIKNYSNKQTITYSVNEKTIENDILTRFVEFLRQNQDSVIITWNMKSTTYGFPHIEQRCKEHGIVTSLPIKQENIVDLDDVLEEKFGKKYIANPKLKRLALLNELNLTSFIDGKDEIVLYEKKDYRTLENSVNRKVSIIDDILDLAFTNKLKTESDSAESSPSTINTISDESELTESKKNDLKETLTLEISDANQNEDSKSARKSAIFYLILLPIAYITFLIVGFVLIYGGRSSVTLLELQNFVYIPMFVFWFIISSYVWKYRKISTSREYFQKLTNNYILVERLFLGKIRIIGIISTITFLAVWITLSSFYNDHEAAFSFIDWTIFSISFSMLNIVMFSHVKISDQEKKKHFKLFMASGFARLCIKNSELKAKYITSALHWYSDFFKKTHHRGLKDVDKIGIRVLASNSSNSTILELINDFESGDEYASINKISEVMKVNVDELFEDETVTQKFRSWLESFGTIATIGTFVIYLLTL